MTPAPAHSAPPPRLLRRLTILDRARRVLPIDFQAPLVRALLENRKRVTRRLLSGKGFAPWEGETNSEGLAVAPLLSPPKYGPTSGVIRCRYGEPGTVLYVREPLEACQGLAIYSATREVVLVGGEPLVWGWQVMRLAARYCPREASRLALENTGVRAERVQAITEEDAVAEGLNQARDGSGLWLPGRCAFARWAFRELWNQLHDADGQRWDDNPGVYRVGLEELQRRAAGCVLPLEASAVSRSDNPAEPDQPGPPPRGDEP